MAASVDFTISFDNPDEEGWIVARVLEVPGAMSQGQTREEARENVLDALRTVLTPDEELAGETPSQIASTCGSLPQREAPRSRAPPPCRRLSRSRGLEARQVAWPRGRGFCHPST
jgi:predicted RNase H-like HicB family nuclease